MKNPARYVKIPVSVEAMQWRDDMAMQELKDFTNDLVKLNDVNQEFYVYDRLHDTWVKFQYGDYIIKGVKGEFYPCDKDVFEETYRPEMFTEDDDLMTDEEIEAENPRKKVGPQITIYPAAKDPIPLAQFLHDRRTPLR